MPTVLLWNVQRRPLGSHIIELVGRHDVDLVVLIEPPEDRTTLAAAVASLNFSPVPSQARFAVHARTGLFTFDRLTLAGTGSRADAWRVGLRTAPSWETLFVAIHGLDRRNSSVAGQALFFATVAAEVRRFEREIGHSRTVVFGDFNSNPFEEPVESVRGLHAINARAIGGRPFRSVQGTDYPFFFNPMWGRFGTAGPAATYHYNGGEPHEHLWHMLDQVVVRPEMLPYFPEERVRVLDAAGAMPLLTRTGLPGGSNSSDHLPLVFHLTRRRRKGYG